MTVSSTTSRVSYAGNGSTTTFSVPFYFLANADLVVIKTNTSTGVQTTLALSTDYSVTGAGVLAGGSITTVVAPTLSETVVIYRDPAVTQLVDYQPNDPFPAQTHETALDKLTMIGQRLKDLISRSFRLSDGDTSTASLTLPSPTAGSFIGWNGTATGLQNYDPTSLATVVAYGTAKAEVFSGNGSTTSFTLTANPAAVGNLDVSVSGVTQRAGIDFNWVTGTTVTFTSAPPAGTNNILIRYFQGLPLASASSASALLGGSGGALVYQSSAGVTGFSAVGSAGQVVLSGGTGAPTFIDQASMTVGAAGTATSATSATTASTSTTQAISDSSTKIATTAFSQSLVSTIDIMGAPQSIAFVPTTSGASTLLPSTAASLSITSQNVTSSAPLMVVGCVSGVNGGLVNQTRLGVSTSNLTWSSLTNTATNYLYVDISSTGALTTGATTSVPSYTQTSSPSTTNGVHTFVIPQMQMYAGNGATAVPVCRVFVGEAVASGGTITSTVSYNPGTSYQSALTATLPNNGTTVTTSHNLGVNPRSATWYAQCTTTDLGYAVGDIIIPFGSGGANSDGPMTPVLGTNAVTWAVYGNAAPTWMALNKSTGVSSTMTKASWSYFTVVSRGW